MKPEKSKKFTLVLFALAIAAVYFVCHLTAEFRTIYNDAIRLKNWAASVRSLEACAIAQKTSGSAMFIECNAADREADMWPVWRALELTIVHFAGDITGFNFVQGLPGMGPDGAVRASIVSAFGWIVHSIALVIPVAVASLVYFSVTGRVNFAGAVKSYFASANKVKVDEPEVDVLVAPQARKPLPRASPWSPPNDETNTPPSNYWSFQKEQPIYGAP